MADNSKILSISTQENLQLDSSIASKNISKGFGRKEDIIELHIITKDNQLVYSEPNFKEYTFPDSSQNSTPTDTFPEIILNPTEILSNRGYVSGRFIIKLNIQRKKIFDANSNPFSIKEISPSRKELRIITPKISNEIFDRSVKSFISEIESSAYFRDFVLNFGNDVNVLGINILLNKDPNKHELLVKTLNSLPISIKENSTFKIVENIIDPQIIDVDLGEPEIDDDNINLRGPNFKIDVRINNSIPSNYKTYNDILEYNVTSSYQRLLNQLENKEIPTIKYDYVRPVSSSTEDIDQAYHFENFVHFSNASERLKNFEYKVKLIELYDSQIQTIEDTEQPNVGISTELKLNIEEIEEKKLKLISGLDGYEQFLYYESGSFATWPKVVATTTETETFSTGTIPSTTIIMTNAAPNFAVNLALTTQNTLANSAMNATIGSFTANGVQVGDIITNTTTGESINITFLNTDFQIQFESDMFIDTTDEWTIGTPLASTFGSLTLSSATFITDGVQVGQTINNTTTGESAVITAVNSETQITFSDSSIITGGIEISAGNTFTITLSTEIPLPGAQSPPYILHSTTSPEVQTWLGDERGEYPNYGGQLLSASLFDKQNEYALVNTIPKHIVDNPDNNFYQTFVHMTGHHFDQLWTHIKAITDINDSHHTRGISKDLVYFQLKSVGIEAFDQFENSNLIEYILGQNTDPSSTTVGDSEVGEFIIGDSSNNFLSIPEGQTLVTASNAGSIPKGDITKEIWKRLYHNAPYLLKTKGTERGLRALMSCYGVPSTILNVKEYGGNTVVSGPLKDLDTADIYKTFTYDKSAFALKGDAGTDGHFVFSKWSSSLGPTLQDPNYNSSTDPNIAGASDNPNSKKHSLEFRIKPTRIINGDIAQNQILMLFSGSGEDNTFISSPGDLTQFMYIEPYSGSDILTTGDSSQYGKLVYKAALGSTTGQTEYFPIYNGDFWNCFAGVDVTGHDSASLNSDVTFGAYQSNFLKNISYYTSSQGISNLSHHYNWGCTLPDSTLPISGGAEHGVYICGGNHSASAMTTNSGLGFKNVNAMSYSGSLQEVRFYRGEKLSHSTLKKHALEPFMYSGNSVSSSYNHLYLRLPLGSNDQQDSSSFHPNIGQNYLNADTNGQLMNPYIIGGGGSSSGFNKAWKIDDPPNVGDYPNITNIGNGGTNNTFLSVDTERGVLKYEKINTLLLVNGELGEGQTKSSIYLPCTELLKDKIYKVSFTIKNYKKTGSLGSVNDPLQSTISMPGALSSTIVKPSTTKLNIKLFSDDGSVGIRGETGVFFIGSYDEFANNPDNTIGLTSGVDNYAYGKTNNKGDRIHYPDSDNNHPSANDLGFYSEPPAQADDLSPNGGTQPNGSGGYNGMFTKMGGYKGEIWHRLATQVNESFANLLVGESGQSHLSRFGPFPQNNQFSPGQQVSLDDGTVITPNPSESPLEEGSDYEFLVKINKTHDQSEYPNSTNNFTPIQDIQNAGNNKIEINVEDRQTFITPLSARYNTSFEMSNFQVELMPEITSHLTSSQEWEETTENHYHLTPDTVGISMTSEKTRIDEGTINDDILSPTIKSEDSTLDRQPQDFEDLGIFFSPTTEINEDIMYTLGAFRLDDYIGSPLPSAQTASVYEDLSDIKDIYFKKVRRNRYNYWDYIKTIQYIDHTLFKLIEQFVPFKANTKTGLLIEPHYLERTKFPRELPIRSDGQTMTTGLHQTFEASIKGETIDELYTLASSSLGGGNVATYAGMVSNQLDDDNRFRKDIGTNTTINVSGYVLDEIQNIAQSPIIPDSTGSGDLKYISDTLLGNATKAIKSRIYYTTRDISDTTNMDINQSTQ